jgi:histidinol-phosphate aminotransferase
MKYGRSLLRDVEGYVPGEQPQDGEYIKLNTNENPYPPAPAVLEAIHEVDGDMLRKYPDPVSMAFRRACAQCYGLPGPEWVLIGNGMDELLALALRTFADPGDRILASYPTYSLYETLARLHGCRMVYSNLDENFQLPETFFGIPARICLLTRPNAPSGVASPREDAERLCRAFDGLVVIDEAYADFADDNCMDFPERFGNALVMRTFSKSFSLAGMRIGTVAAAPPLIREFLKTKDSYNMDALSQRAGLAAIRDYHYMRESVRKVRETREKLRGNLRNLGFDVPPSQTNFLLARRDLPPSARSLYEKLKEKKILVRYFAAPGLENALRITIGTPEECDRLVETLHTLLETA